MNQPLQLADTLALVVTTYVPTVPEEAVAVVMVGERVTTLPVTVLELLIERVKLVVPCPAVTIAPTAMPVPVANQPLQLTGLATVVVTEAEPLLPAVATDEKAAGTGVVG